MLFHEFVDTLAVRSPLRQMESLTGYIIFLAFLNGIRSINGISITFFPTQYKRVAHKMMDFPPLTLTQLAKATRLTAEVLLQSTFFHIGLKFSRSTHPQALS